MNEIARSESPMPATYFASPGRASAAEIAAAAERATQTPVVQQLLHCMGAFVLILDEHRQILAVNDGLLTHLGIPSVEDLLGLRAGEAMHCIHAHDEPAGCGTTCYCAGCGAAIATVLALDTGETSEAECLLAVDQGREGAIEMAVRAVPLDVDGQRLVMLLLQDIRLPKRREALERTFFHDINNLMSFLLSTLEIARLKRDDESERRVGNALTIGKMIADEVEAQMLMTRAISGRYSPLAQPTSIGLVLDRLEEIFALHHVAKNRNLTIDRTHAQTLLFADEPLLRRVLVNMLKNAFEATPEGGTVSLTTALADETLTWHVWNEGIIDPEIRPYIFQRYRSTKASNGRGLGTYGMRLLAEQYLGGAVSFASNAEDGTTFSFTHPRDMKHLAVHASA